ncbi:Conserved hypothetical protein [Prochlorococcus marinus str. MIT 9313]|uniref:Uncharacterized protein n=1 Tax=Prochlorococcus marinus (strain MIT 9313) TaxID=74547 RepID=B9ER49_PROMM|nr:Conserved hypothetical protein [Prochlorococcus marinus str. MIT 9313]
MDVGNSSIVDNLRHEKNSQVDGMNEIRFDASDIKLNERLSQ